MNNYNPNSHHRRSIRLKGYDYSQAGLYFITICCQDRACLFGEIENHKMHLNEAGTMIVKWYYELEQKFGDIKCHEMVVMPNHFHCIIENVGSVGAVGADLCVCPDVCETNGPKTFVCDADKSEMDKFETDKSVSNILGEHAGSPLHRVVGWFKTMTTNEYIRGVKTLDWKRFDEKLWQRNYYEHIIRNEKSFEMISNYIIDNPAKWNQDKLK